MATETVIYKGPLGRIIAIRGIFRASDFQGEFVDDFPTSDEAMEALQGIVDVHQRLVTDYYNRHR